MLPDFRFVLGAVLAIALLAVAGLGLVSSVQLVREAHMGPIEDSRSLAFAGHAGWNQFYDPEGARRFEGLAGKSEIPAAQARLETPPEVAPVAAPLGAQERTASLPPNRIDPDIADDRTTDTNPPSRTETSAGVMVAPPAEAARAPVADAPGSIESDPPAADRVASAPATLPVADHSQEIQDPAPTQPQATGDPQRNATPPIPPARPKAQFRKKIARTHIRRRVTVASQQASSNAILPTTTAPWPGYDNPWTGTATTKKTVGKLSGTTANRPQ
jgi:hypothetical protein